MSDPPLRDCPKGGGIIMRVITGGTGMIFKGSGFYATDHKSPSGQVSHKSKKDKEAPAAESKTGTAEKESKPAPKDGAE